MIFMDVTECRDVPSLINLGLGGISKRRRGFDVTRTGVGRVDFPQLRGRRVQTAGHGLSWAG